MRLFKCVLQHLIKGRRGEKGFSLLEVLVSIGLLSLLGVAFFVSLNIMTNRITQVDGETTAEALAKSEIEYIKAASYTNAPWSYQLPDTPPAWDVTHTLPDGFPAYTLSASAGTISGQGDDIQKITVTVTRGTQSEPWEYANCTLSGYKVNR